MPVNSAVGEFQSEGPGQLDGLRRAESRAHAAVNDRVTAREHALVAETDEQLTATVEPSGSTLDSEPRHATQPLTERLGAIALMNILVLQQAETARKSGPKAQLEVSTRVRRRSTL